MKTFLKFICNAAEILCCLTHPFAEAEIRLTGRFCNLSLFSVWLNDKYDLGVWKEVKPEKRYWENYP